MAEVLKNIAEAEPKKPSTIRRQINDEVETIILKALAKERERRYQSADTLARNRKYAIVVIAILSAVVTPTPDPINMGLVMLPLLLLYEIAIFLARLA